MCSQEGRITAASVVDHRIPHRGNPALFWSEDNLQPLCDAHHNGTKQAIEKNTSKGIGEDGWPL